MLELRPLIIVTGTVHVEGGLTKHVRSKPTGKNGDTAVVTEDRKIHPDRRAANVIATDYMRKLRSIKILRTPFGVLVDPQQLSRVKELLVSATEDVSAFNKTHSHCALANTMLWEHLRGNRLDAVRGWIDRRRAENDQDVKNALVALRPERVAA